jgi:hypothetical protein
MFDEEPDPDPHGECLREITRLKNERDHALSDLKAEIANHREDLAALGISKSRVAVLESQADFYAEWMPPEDYTQLSRRVDDLAALVRLLVHNIRKFNIDNVPATRAVDYLKRHRLTGSILRADEPQPADPTT